MTSIMLIHPSEITYENGILTCKQTLHEKNTLTIALKQCNAYSIKNEGENPSFRFYVGGMYFLIMPEIDKCTKLSNIIQEFIADWLILNSNISNDEKQWLNGQPKPWTAKTCAIAARKGDLAVLKLLHNIGCPWDEEACSRAAAIEDFDSLKYLHENGCPWDEKTCANAATIQDSYYCLEYAHENGCPWNKETCANAARIGNLKCLKYLHENGCPWDEKTYENAGEYKRWDCLRYALENGCPRTEKVYDISPPKAGRSGAMKAKK